MTSYEAGRELDALVAERVMGEVLTLPRERAMAIAGATYTVVTGPRFKLNVHGYDVTVDVPPGDEIPGHPSDDNYNQRYFRHVAAELLKFPNEIGELVERDIAACRIPPKPYSADIAAAWLVVEKMRESGWLQVEIWTDADEWIAAFWRPQHRADRTPRRAASLPEAICLAALATCAALPVSERRASND